MSAPTRRLIYALLIVLVVLMGLLSRRLTGIPPMVGDVLWAVMMFLIIRFLLIDQHWRKVALISLFICYAVETSQLYHAPWIDNIRNTLLGSLVLGHGFLWSDLLAYTLGVGIAAFLTKIAASSSTQRQ